MSDLMNAIYNKDKEYILNLFENILNKYIEGGYESIFENNKFEFDNKIENNIYYDLFKMLYNNEYRCHINLDENLLFDDKIILYLSLNIDRPFYNKFIIDNLKRMRNILSFHILSGYYYRFNNNKLKFYYAKKSIKLSINNLIDIYENKYENKYKYYRKYYLYLLKNNKKYIFYLFAYYEKKNFIYFFRYYRPKNLKIYIKMLLNIFNR